MSLSTINPRKSSVTGLGDFVVDYDYKITNYEAALAQLDTYYGYVKRLILRHQSITLGLFPFNSADDTVADVRTSLYCALAIWALYQSYRRIDDDKGRSHELSHSAIKCMRGILWCWMRQAQRVEQFKQRQFKEFALHVKFHLLTGDVVIPDDEYNHLQLDVVSLYLLTLVQIITSGLQVIYCMDEVKFIQNLVYYVERAYRTPDFGMWERGTKYNNGTPEIHASSIGMAKAALEAINGCNLFGDKGASWSVIYVDIDAHDRNRSIFETLLPRESRSKNADCALLPTLSFPAFGTHDDVIYGTTKEKVIDKLEGEYGFKRFLRDGYGNALEDPRKTYYEHGETKKFDGVESEWPLFFIYLIIDGMFKADQVQVKKYQLKLRDVILYSVNGDPIIPLYYFVEEGYMEYERQDPGSQPKTRSLIGTENDMFLWGQSLYIISQLLVDGVLHINELDPIRRYLPSYNRPRNSARYSAFQGTASDLVVQVVLVSESMRLQAMMATYGIQTQTPKEIEPIQICAPGQLVKIYRKLGVNKRLGLSGRPARPIGALGTSKIYRILGHTFITYPLIFEVSDFYLSYDMALLIDDIKSELKFVGKFWRLSGRPTVCILIREEHMRDANFKKMLDLLAMLKSGHCDDQKIRLGRLQNFMASSCIEHLDFLDRAQPHLLEIESIKQLTHVSIGYQSLTDIPKAILYSEPSFSYKEFESKPTTNILEALKTSDTLFAQSGLLGILMQREGDNYLADSMSVRDRLVQINKQAGVLRVWKVVRHCSSLLHKLVDSLSPSLSSILVNGKEVTIGVYGKEEVVLDKPMTPAEIRVLLYQVTAGYDPVQAVLQQEILLYAGKLIATNPKLFSGLLKFRIGWVLRAMSLYMKWTAGEDTELEACSPSEIRQTLYKVLTYSSEQQTTTKFNHHQKRQLDGCLGRVPKDFFIRVWHILMRTEVGVNIGTSMISRKDMAEMTVTDFDFAITIETMLNKIPYPEYRQLSVELIMVMSTILERNPELHFVDKVKLDDLIGDALMLYLKDNYNDQSNDMESFYAASHGCVTGYLSRAVVNHILKGDLAKMSADSEFKGCNIS